MKITAKRLLASATLAVLVSLLSGCYVAPDYSYARSNGYVGDAYYGSGPAVIYNGYYGDGYYGAGYPYGYGYDAWGGWGCCYGGWYGRGHYWRGDHDHDWHGRGGHEWHGDRGGWHGGHGWHGASHGGHGGWHGGSRDH